MHITEDMQTAIDTALKGTRVVETQFEHKFGYPIVNGEGIIVYSPDEMKVDGGGEKNSRYTGACKALRGMREQEMI